MDKGRWMVRDLTSPISTASGYIYVHKFMEVII